VYKCKLIVLYYFDLQLEIITELFSFVNKKMIDRIKKLLEKEQLSPSQFADEINIQRSSLSHVLSGRNKPSLDFVMKIKQRFPDINLDWLIFGDGDMLIKKIESSSKIIKESPIYDTKTSNQQILNFESQPKQSDKHADVDMTQSSKENLESIKKYGESTKIIILYGNGTFEEFTKN